MIVDAGCFICCFVRLLGLGIIWIMLYSLVWLVCVLLIMRVGFLVWCLLLIAYGVYVVVCLFLLLNYAWIDEFCLS